jgi:hypothetical protein
VFAIVGVTLDDVMANSLPLVRLALALKARPIRNPESIVVYTNDPANTQSQIFRAKYKDQGVLLNVLYFSEAAVEACNECHVALRILDYVNEGALPATKVIAFQHSSVTTPSTSNSQARLG